MQMKPVLAIGALMLGTLGIASAKSYNFTLSDNTDIGGTQLKAGHYSLKVNGSQAEFRNTDTNSSVSAPVTIQSAPTKFNNTMVLTDQRNGADHLQEIDLGGSKTKLEFGG